MPIPSQSPASQASPAGGKSKAWPYWAALFGLAALFLLLRWNNLGAPLIRDEGEYAYSAQALESGGLPYRDAFIQKPPMVVYTYLLADTLIPGVFWAPRLLAAAFVALATLLLGAICGRELGREAAWPSMWLVTPMILLPGVEQCTANTEMFMLLPLLGVLAVYSRGRSKPLVLKYWIAGGVLAATTLLYKYTALPLVAFVFAVWSVEAWRANRSVKSLAGCHGALLLGGLLAAAVELGYFLYRDRGASFWDCTIAFNRAYAASDNFGAAGWLLKLKTLVSSWWVLFLLTGAAFLNPPPRLWFWCGMLACGCLAAGGSYYGQYYVLLMPFWALLAAAGIDALAGMLARRSSLTAGQIRAGLTALAMVLLLLPDAPWLSLPPDAFAAAKYARHSVFLESPAVGRRVAELSGPMDRVWVAASEPEILVYAHRQSPTRFITVYSLVIPSPELDAYQAQAIQEVRAHPPKLIVWARSWLQDEPQPSNYLLFLNDMLARSYQRVGGYVVAGKDSRWAEPLADADAAAASVVLYERKTSSP